MRLWPFGKKEKPAPVQSVAKVAEAENAPPAVYERTAADSSLSISALQNHVEGIKASLEKGANVNSHNPYDPNSPICSHDYTPLMFACSQGPDALKAVNLLLKAGADVNHRTYCNMTALLSAAEGASMYGNGSHLKDAGPLIDALVAAGADVNDQNAAYSALGSTINLREKVISVSAVKALLKHGADPNRDPTYPSLLSAMCEITAASQDIAVYCANLEVINAMIEAGAEVNPSGLLLRLNETPLGFAATHGAVDLLRTLLSKGADPNLVNMHGVSLLETVRMNMAQQLEKGESIVYTHAIIEALEEAIMRTPDGKGQGGDAAQKMNPVPLHHHIG